MNNFNHLYCFCGALVWATGCAVESPNQDAKVVPGTIELTRCPEFDDCTPGQEEACDEYSERPGAIIPCVMRGIVIEYSDGSISECQAYSSMWEMCFDETPTTWSSSSPICPDSECTPGDASYCPDGSQSDVCGVVGGAAVDEDGNPYFCLKGVYYDLGDCPESEKRGTVVSFDHPVTKINTYENQAYLGVDTRIPPGAWVTVPIDRWAKAALIHIAIAVGKYDTGISFAQPAGAPYVYVGPSLPGKDPFIFPWFGGNYSKTWQTALDENGNAFFLNDTRAPVHLRFDVLSVMPRYPISP